MCHWRYGYGYHMRSGGALKRARVQLSTAGSEAESYELCRDAS